MDCLSKEQLLLLQHHLTYETYEEFMSMFDKGEESFPENEEELERFILDILKRHKYFGQITGWGDNAIFVNIPSDFKNSLLKFHIVNSNLDTKKDLVEYLDNYPHKEILNVELKDKNNSCLRVKDSL